MKRETLAIWLSVIALVISAFQFYFTSLREVHDLSLTTTSLLTDRLIGDKRGNFVVANFILINNGTATEAISACKLRVFDHEDNLELHGDESNFEPAVLGPGKKVAITVFTDIREFVFQNTIGKNKDAKITLCLEFLDSDGSLTNKDIIVGSIKFEDPTNTIRSRATKISEEIISVNELL